MSRSDDIYSALVELGADADRIAVNLSTLNCKGERESSTSCPVYVYLERRFGDIHSVDVGTIEFVDDDWLRTIGTPAAVDAFIDRFDAGQFPELAVE